VYLGPLEVLRGGDDAIVERPRRDAVGECRLCVVERRRVRDGFEREPEPPLHFFHPLVEKARRNDQQRAPPHPARHQLDEAQSRLDGLAEPDIVGDEQVAVRAGEEAGDRHELVRLELDAAGMQGSQPVGGRREAQQLVAQLSRSERRKGAPVEDRGHARDGLYDVGGAERGERLARRHATQAQQSATRRLLACFDLPQLVTQTYSLSHAPKQARLPAERQLRRGASHQRIY